MVAVLTSPRDLASDRAAAQPQGCADPPETLTLAPAPGQPIEHSH